MPKNIPVKTLAAITVLTLTGAVAQAAPTPPKTLPTQIDNPSTYHAQNICTPQAKKGTIKFKNMLTATYGNIPIGIDRPCNYGVTEHSEGRALDWMVNSKITSQRKKGDEFIAWLLANDAQMAKRLGVMYIIWKDKIWGIYKATEGWRDYQTCSTDKTKQTPEYDTSCHRDHVHISLSWWGAAGKTSYWTGKPITVQECPSTTQTATYTPGTPTNLFNSYSIKTIENQKCRLSAYNYASYNSLITLNKLPQYTYTAHLVLKNYSNPAPANLQVSSKDKITIPYTTTKPYKFKLTLNNQNTINIKSMSGYAAVKIQLEKITKTAKV